MGAEALVARAIAATQEGAPAASWADRLMAIDWPWVGCGAAVGLASFLLFLAQPLFARLALPVYGGGAGVWTAALVFSQAALVLGYGYAHLTRALPLRTQAALHLGLMWAVLGAPAIGVPIDHAPVAPVALDFLRVSAVRLGPPLVILGATGVLVQRWLAACAARPERTYALFALSSAGSLAGLLAFPFLLEPAMDLATQGLLWRSLYTGLVLLVTASSVWLLREKAGGGAHVERGAHVVAWPGWRLCATWVVLAAAPCAVMVSSTAALTTDVAVPLLWMAPPAVYLATYVAAFAPGPRWAGLPAAPAAAVVLSAVMATAGRLAQPLGLLAVVHLAALAVVCLGCHARLAAARPGAAEGSWFFLCGATGGAIGGVLAGVVAPHALDTMWEYPAALTAAWLLGYAVPPDGGRRGWLMDAAWAAAVGVMTAALLWRASDGWAITGVVGSGVLLAPAALACLTFAGRPLRFGLAAGAVLAVAHLAPAGGAVLDAERTPYGLHRVRAVDGDGIGDRFHLLFHGTTMHGVQRRGATGDTEPLGYYHRGSGVGDVFGARSELGESGDVGVVGLGTGALACYARPGERWTFFELDPAVERIARDERLFTYLRDCAPSAEVVLGDGRLRLAALQDGALGVLVLDAYSSDAVPIHLLTREAVDLYRRKLTPGGVIAFHISNRHLDLEPVLGALARELGLVCLVRWEDPGARGATGTAPSRWAVMGDLRGAAGEDGVLRRLAGDRRWLAARTDAAVPAWRDGYAPVARVVRWG